MSCGRRSNCSLHEWSFRQPCCPRFEAQLARGTSRPRCRTRARRPPASWLPREGFSQVGRSRHPSRNTPFKVSRSSIARRGALNRHCQEAGATDEDFHALRKSVQQHWRHMQLLSRAWPEALSARADEAKALSQLLGEDHDLYVLRSFAEAHCRCAGRRRDHRPRQGDDGGASRFAAACPAA